MPPDGHRSEGTLSPSEVPYAGVKLFGSFLAFEKGTRCKSETASGNTRSNGYTPNPQTKKSAILSNRAFSSKPEADYQLPRAFEANQNKPADSATVAGRVSTHASRMVRTVPPCRPLLLATMVPATPEDST